MATRAEVIRRYGFLAALGLVAAALLCSRPWETNENPPSTPFPGPIPTRESTPFPQLLTAATAIPTQVIFSAEANGIGCFDFLGNSPDNYYLHGEFTPHTNSPEKGRIVFCNNGQWDVTTINPDGTTYHVLVTSPFQP